jgi:hypothetical protein
VIWPTAHLGRVRRLCKSKQSRSITPICGEARRAGVENPKPHVGGADVSELVIAYERRASGPAVSTRVALDPGVVTARTNGRGAARTAQSTITSWAKRPGAAAQSM